MVGRLLNLFWGLCVAVCLLGYEYRSDEINSLYLSRWEKIYQILGMEEQVERALWSRVPTELSASMLAEELAEDIDEQKDLLVLAHELALLLENPGREASLERLMAGFHSLITVCDSWTMAMAYRLRRQLKNRTDVGALKVQFILGLVLSHLDPSYLKEVRELPSSFGEEEPIFRAAWLAFSGEFLRAAAILRNWQPQSQISPGIALFTSATARLSKDHILEYGLLRKAARGRFQNLIMGRLHRILDDIVQDQDSLRQILEEEYRKPEVTPYIRWLLALLYDRLDEPQEVLRVQNGYPVTYLENFADHQKFVVKAHVRLRQFDAAVVEAHKAFPEGDFRKSPSIKLLEHYAEALRGLNKPSEAAEVLRFALESRPGMTALHLFLAQILHYDLHQTQQALQSIDTYLSFHPDDQFGRRVRLDIQRGAGE